jgi:hypothetical protein
MRLTQQSGVLHSVTASEIRVRRPSARSLQRGSFLVELPGIEAGGKPQVSQF